MAAAPRVVLGSEFHQVLVDTPRGPPGVADLTPPNSPTTPPSRAQAVHSGLWTTWAQGLHLCSHRLGNECFWGWSVSH